MYEGAAGVKRLLTAIYQNADDETIRILSRLLHYNERQLKEDIEAINHVVVTDIKDRSGGYISPQ